MISGKDSRVSIPHDFSIRGWKTASIVAGDKTFYG